MVLRKSFYIRWSAGRSPRVHEVNPGRDPSIMMYGAPLPFLLRVGHVTLLFLWMIFSYILGFISSKIILNFIKYIVTLPK